MTEVEALARLQTIAAKNRVLTSFIGQGYYGTHTPGVILRNVLENPAWYTAYTPYQPEISQGRLEALVNFQTMVCDLTGMAIANASMLDEATAAAEAMTLCRRMSRSTSTRFFVADDVFAQTRDVVRTRARAARHRSRRRSRARTPRRPTRSPCCCSTRVPTARSATTARRCRKRCTRAAGIVVVAADILALTLLAPPGEWGADVVVGSTQRFGVPMGYGGPHAGYLATRDDFKRSMPGRLVGVTVDADGEPAYRLALQTREQHIRREKATSNICTAQVLLAVIAACMRSTTDRPVSRGSRGACTGSRRFSRPASARLGFAVPTAAFFDTITVATGARTRAILAAASRRRINFRRVGCDERSASRSTRRRRRADVERVWRIFAGGDVAFSVAALDSATVDALPATLVRTTPFLTHPTFNRYHCETEMLRYLRRLADLDIALDRAMIPLGSCTMKLNATAEMIPVTWPEFADLHPFAPAGPGAGYRELVVDLERMLCAMTGYAAVSLQPNAGLAGRVRRPARDPRVSREPRRRSSQRLPHSRVGARDEPGVRADGRDAGRRRRLRRRRQRRSRRSRGEGGSAPRPISRRSWSRIRRRTACSRQASGRSARSSTPTAGRSTSTAPISTRWSASPHPASSAPTSRTSTCTRRSASRTAAAARAWARSASARISRRSCPAIGTCRDRATATGAVARRPVRQREHPADLVDVHRDDGRRRPDRGDRMRDPRGELRREAAGRPLSGALRGPRRTGRARMHPRSAAAEGNLRRRRRRRRQAADGLRLPRADDELPGCRAR